METWNLLISKRIRPKRLSFNKLILVGAEGFELDLGPSTKTRIFCDLGPKREGLSTYAPSIPPTAFSLVYTSDEIPRNIRILRIHEK
jgi:hypothetical protein